MRGELSWGHRGSGQFGQELQGGRHGSFRYVGLCKDSAGQLAEVGPGSSWSVEGPKGQEREAPGQGWLWPELAEPGSDGQETRAQYEGQGRGCRQLGRGEPARHREGEQLGLDR